MGRRQTPERGLTVACLATCPPRQCGIATFATDLAGAMSDADPDLEVRFAAIEAAECLDYGPDVAWRVRQGDPASYRFLAYDLNAADVDVVLVQHEFGLVGLWGPVFDDHLAGFLDAVDAPVVSILHSVPPEPSPSVRSAVRALAAASARLIVMTNFAQALLFERYGLDPETVSVIPHGVPSPATVERDVIRRSLGVENRQLISTFGFLDPHKGIEHMIAAMEQVANEFPQAEYVVVGRTHPELARREGEQYRRALEAAVRSRGLEDHVRFVDAYVSLEQIVAYLAASDIYATPYLDMNQVTSGTLAYALGQGRAIVSTPYIHAVDALADGCGVLVPPANSQALAAAILDLLRRPEYRRAIEKRALAQGRAMEWPVVARQTLGVLRSAVRSRSLQPSFDASGSPRSDQTAVALEG